ncbi:hypothetical protein BCR44DRAFT_209434 [Catenaria anguillulae PL171]|uniref:Uncharacterized protein n=1 Tax=Catenaria anguillulae PL171 TaxID=765915 RepID=A0A1Y2H9A8_9FUNG|nr:hypothetical protein BCR44DRAFT_209434 [Catenaria anguillulae PL171]
MRPVRSLCRCRRITAFCLLLSVGSRVGILIAPAEVLCRWWAPARKKRELEDGACDEGQV